MLSTASPYKFPEAVLEALTGEQLQDGFLAMERLEAYTGIPAPDALRLLPEKEVRFTGVIDIGEMEDTVTRFAKGEKV